jgi:hypothetical protein
MNICLIGQSSCSESGLLARLAVAPAVAFALTACHNRQKTPAPRRSPSSNPSESGMLAHPLVDDALLTLKS